MTEVAKQTIAKVYDMELVNTAATALIYMLSGMDLKEMAEHKALAMSYRQNLNKTAYDQFMEKVSRLKNPLAEEQTPEFAAGIFVVLQNVFQSSSAGADEQRAKNGFEPFSHEDKEAAFSQWVTRTLNLVYSMLTGQISCYTMDGEMKPHDTAHL